MCILLCEGKYENGMFYLLRVLHPPLHANKQFKYKLNEQDYFGSYMQMTETMNRQFKHQSAQLAIAGEIQTSMNEVKEASEDDSLSKCIVIVNQLQIDESKHHQALRKMFIGLEDFRPEVIVLIGDYISQENNETESFDKIRQYFDAIGSIIREDGLTCLRDLTQWILMPSPNDPGMCKLLPNFHLSEYLIAGMKGNGPQRIKKILLATNPMRMSFRGKEIVFCRYNYFKKIKRNHLAKFQEQQEKQNQ